MTECKKRKINTSRGVRSKQKWIGIGSGKLEEEWKELNYDPNAKLMRTSSSTPEENPIGY